MRTLLLALALLLPATVQAQDYSAEPDPIASNFTTSEDIDPTPYTPTDGMGDAKYRSGCEYTHSNWDDMLLFPGLVGGNPHSHAYFSNPTVNANSTYSSLRQNGVSSCAGKRIWRSAYWRPDLYVDETHVKIEDHVILYYAYDGRALDGGIYEANYTPARLPRSLAMITGAKPGDPTYYDNPPGVTLGANQSFDGFTGFVGWHCESSGSFYPDLEDPGLDCAAGDPLMANFEFPECWNGSTLSSATYRDHVVHSFPDGALGIRACPTSHPYLLAKIEVRLVFSHNGPDDYRNWWWSSDRQDANPANWANNGATGHVDFKEALDDGYRDMFQHFCNGLSYNSVTGVQHSGVGGQFCVSGETGEIDHVDSSETVDAQNIVAAPVRVVASAVNGARLRMRFRRR